MSKCSRVVAEEFTDAGFVKSVNPARRELRVEAADGVITKLEGRTWLHVRDATGEVMRCKIAKLSPQRGFAIVTVAAGVPRDTVAGLKGSRVVLPADEMKERDGREVDAAELTGMSVVGVNGPLIGEVVSGFETKANGVLEVLRPDGGSLLLPLVPEVIEEIDWDANKVVVHDIAPFAVENDNGPRLT